MDLIHKADKNITDFFFLLLNVTDNFSITLKSYDQTPACD